jgi:hypothetical protein
MCYLGVSDLAATQAGSIVLYMVYILRDVIMMALEIVFNIALIYFLKAYFDKKTTLVVAMLLDEHVWQLLQWRVGVMVRQLTKSPHMQLTLHL